MPEEKKEPQVVWFKNKNTGVKWEVLDNSESFLHMKNDPLNFEVTEAPVEEPKKGKKA